jgi:hypothetical protein
LNEGAGLVLGEAGFEVADGGDLGGPEALLIDTVGPLGDEWG